MRKMVLALTLTTLLSACAQNAGPGQIGDNKTTAGAVLGGVGGAVVGAQFGHGAGKLAATAAGTLLGAVIGGSVGASLDRADAMYADKAGGQAFETAPTGHPVAWNNPDNGHSGTVTPVKTYETSPGQYCREYEQTIMVGGERQNSYGTACRQPDGTWKIQN